MTDSHEAPRGPLIVREKQGNDARNFMDVKSSSSHFLYLKLLMDKLLLFTMEPWFSLYWSSLL